MLRISVVSIVLVLLLLLCAADVYPAGWKKQPFSTHYYCAVPQPVGFYEAELVANDMGGYLATITSAEEQSFVASVLSAHVSAGGWWLGGYQDTETTLYEPGGNWMWIPWYGDTWSYTNWASGQPNNGYGDGGVAQDVLSIWPSLGYGWNDWAAYGDDIDGFVIERHWPLQPYVFYLSSDQAPNTGTVDGVILIGGDFEEGASVKLTRANEADIHAGSVEVVDPTMIRCSFDLAGRKPGLWDISVANPDGSSATRPESFAITLPDTFAVCGVNNKGAADPLMDTARLGRRFKVWGKLSDDYYAHGFVLDDGSGNPINVWVEQYPYIDAGDYLCATGTLDSTVNPPVLLSSTSQVRKLN